MSGTPRALFIHESMHLAKNYEESITELFVMKAVCNAGKAKRIWVIHSYDDENNDRIQ